MTREELMLAMQNGLLGQPETYGGLLDQQQQGAARNNGLINFGASLLANSGPSRQPVGFGQAIGQATLAGRSAQAQSTQGAISAALLKKQLTDKSKKDLVTAMGADGKPIYVDATNAEGMTPYSMSPTSKDATDIQYYNTYASQEKALGRNPMSFQDWAKDYYGGKQAMGYSIQDVNGVPTRVLTRAPVGMNQEPNATALTTADQQAAGQSHVKGAVAGAEASASTTGKGLAERKLDQPRAQIAIQTTGSSLDALAQAAQTVQNDPALAKITGATGKIPDWPGGPAADVRAKLATLKAKAGFNALQTMRDASKTGGALGAVSEREGEWLQNAMAALDTVQSPESFKQQLQIIIDFANASKGRMQQGYDLTYGEHPQITQDAGTSGIAAAAKAELERRRGRK